MKKLKQKPSNLAVMITYILLGFSSLIIAGMVVNACLDFAAYIDGKPIAYSSFSNFVYALYILMLSVMMYIILSTTLEKIIQAPITLFASADCNQVAVSYKLVYEPYVTSCHSEYLPDSGKVKTAIYIQLTIHEIANAVQVAHSEMHRYCGLRPISWVDAKGNIDTIISPYITYRAAKQLQREMLQSEITPYVVLCYEQEERVYSEQDVKAIEFLISQQELQRIQRFRRGKKGPFVVNAGVDSGVQMDEQLLSKYEQILAQPIALSDPRVKMSEFTVQ